MYFFGRTGTRGVWHTSGYCTVLESPVSVSGRLFSSKLAASYSLFAPDLPGFGVSPCQPGKMSLNAAAGITIDLINALSRNRPVLLVGHSLGSVIATWAARKLGETVKAVFSIEGNLTRSDGYFSALAAEFEDATAFYRYFLDLIYERAAKSEAYQRYLASLRFASPKAMMAWGRSSAQLGETGTHGSDFASLKCAKLYYWGTKSTPEETQRFIETHGIPNRQYIGDVHWPMIDTPDCVHIIIWVSFSRVWRNKMLLLNPKVRFQFLGQCGERHLSDPLRP